MPLITNRGFKTDFYEQRKNVGFTYVRFPQYWKTSKTRASVFAFSLKVFFFSSLNLQQSLYDQNIAKEVIFTLNCFALSMF